MRILKPAFRLATLVTSMVPFFLLAANYAASADSDFIRVFMNHARVLKLDRPVAKVIVGNSQVADAAVADAKTIVLTGRNFGTTNLVLLDANDNAIVDQRILVSIDEGNTVRVFRQTDRTVYSCTPNCEKHADTSSSGSSGGSGTSTSGSSTSTSGAESN